MSNNGKAEAREVSVRKCNRRVHNAEHRRNERGRRQWS
jgi:hypothetical protein